MVRQGGTRAGLLRGCDVLPAAVRHPSPYPPRWYPSSVQRTGACRGPSRQVGPPSCRRRSDECSIAFAGTRAPSRGLPPCGPSRRPPGPDPCQRQHLLGLRCRCAIAAPASATQERSAVRPWVNVSSFRGRFSLLPYFVSLHTYTPSNLSPGLCAMCARSMSCPRRSR